MRSRPSSCLAAKLLALRPERVRSARARCASSGDQCALLRMVDDVMLLVFAGFPLRPRCTKSAGWARRRWWTGYAASPGAHQRSSRLLLAALDAVRVAHRGVLPAVPHRAGDV